MVTSSAVRPLWRNRPTEVPLLLTADAKPVLVGHPFSPIGRAEDIRCAFRALSAVGVGPSVLDIFKQFRNTDPDFEREIGEQLVDRLSPSLNVFFINGDEVQKALQHLRQALPASACNVIVPNWELSRYPQAWAEQLERFDEIWTPSKFVFESVRPATTRPVIQMPLPVQVQLSAMLGRRYFDLPESAYLFLFLFDFRSYVERKNPFAIIEAFDRVCRARPNSDVRLVLKLSRPGNAPETEAAFNRFMAAIEACPYRDRIRVIDQTLTDRETKNLIRCCDCFVSLHRSEGFGRGLAEAMYLRKPVVATGYSGNLEFMNAENSCLVRYTLVDVPDGQYPYAAGQQWAEAEIDHAAEYMLRLLDDRGYGRDLGEIASRHMRVHFGYRAVGLRYARRLTEILDSQAPL